MKLRFSASGLRKPKGHLTGLDRVAHVLMAQIRVERIKSPDTNQGKRFPLRADRDRYSSKLSCSQPLHRKIQSCILLNGKWCVHCERDRPLYLRRRPTDDHGHRCLFLRTVCGEKMSLDGDTLSVIENPTAVSHPFHSEKTAGVAGTKRVQGWLKGIHSTTHAHRLVRLLAALCAVGLLGGLAVGVWFLVKLLLRPSSSQSAVGLGDTKETTFCNVTEDISISDPRKGSVFYRISPENSLLEIQLGKLPTWLPVCYERWNSSLGTLVCRQLGYLRFALLTESPTTSAPTET
ncbi:unnamed protein product [Pleuronectes platessa]|uniref:SRCR domain-containing protein n=1 Tax=Pleuronectes platessa TaxID=8262 RepID=A0A9N7YS78_PLEPL|nr:unnamed protein product [Pleuronectes platessa]